jgi:hypothetical protein
MYPTWYNLDGPSPIRISLYLRPFSPRKCENDIWNLQPEPVGQRSSFGTLIYPKTCFALGEHILLIYPVMWETGELGFTVSFSALYEMAISKPPSMLQERGCP